MLRSIRVRWVPAVAALALAASLGCITTDSHEPLEADPVVVAQKQAEARYNLGIDHLRKGRTALAVREFRASLELEEPDAWTHLAIAEAYRRQGRTDDAVVHLNRAMELREDFHSARLNLSGVHIQRGEFDLAAAECQILLDDPTFSAPWRALTNLGWAQYRLGDRDSARRNLRMASQYNERYWPAMLNLGILEAEAGQRLEALTLYQQVLDLDPGPLAGAEAHYRSAEIFIAIGQQEKAVPHLVAASEAKPSGKWGEKSEEYLKLLR